MDSTPALPFGVADEGETENDRRSSHTVRTPTRSVGSQRAVAAVYQADIAFANAVFGPPIARDFLVADLDRKIAATDAAMAEVGGGDDLFAGHDQFELAQDDWAVVQAEVALALVALDDSARLDHALQTFDAMAAMERSLEPKHWSVGISQHVDCCHQQSSSISPNPAS